MQNYSRLIILLISILSFYFLSKINYFDKTETYVSSYGKPDFAIAKLCFISLLETDIKANFLLFPLFTIRSQTSRQPLLCLQAVKEQRNNRLRNFLLPTLLILLRSLTLLPDSLIVDLIPT